MVAKVARNCSSAVLCDHCGSTTQERLSATPASSAIGTAPNAASLPFHLLERERTPALGRAQPAIPPPGRRAVAHGGCTGGARLPEGVEVLGVADLGAVAAHVHARHV